MKLNLLKISLFLTLISGTGCNSQDIVSEVDIIDADKKNSYYIGNRAPLQPSVFIKLPVGSVKPEGWLKAYLEKQRDGLTGYLGEISAWLQKEDNAWLSEDGTGKWGWEEVPYWLKGYANLGYILDDNKMIDEAKIWLEAVIRGQRENGNFGPKRFNKDGSQDFWGNMIMLYCLQSYYEYSGDQRVIDLMTKYFEYQLEFPEDKFLTYYWQKIRGGDNLHSVLWLYNRTGDKFLLELAEKIHRNTADWTSRGHSLDAIHSRKHKRETLEKWPGWYGDQIDWHNVNHAQCFREPAQYYLLSGDKKHLEASYENFEIIRKHFGQVPGGMFGSDENCRPGYDDPRQGIETCGIVEQLNSNEHMLRITGDPFWADHAEEVAFNTYPAATMPDFKSLRYITAPNMVLCDRENHHPGIDNSGPFLMMNPFSSRCCQHNHAQGWPYYVENLWMATPDNGLVTALYGACKVTAKVGDGTEVTIREETNYPFEEEIRFTVESEKAVDFPLYIRIPKWCDKPSVKVNGKSIPLQAAGRNYVRIQRRWGKGDKVELGLPMELGVKTWTENHNSVSVSYGPLTFSLKIDENYKRMDSEKTAIGDSRWQNGVDKSNWPSWEIYPASDWNYGLIYNAKKPEKFFEVVKNKWPPDDFPFTPKSVPIKIKAKGKRIPEWKLDEHKLCGELMDSPVASTEKEEEIELIPMGAARLRISAFPVIKQ
ncbi:MAG: glycoside hydrolase family 127 protein [Cytophagales bacterium]|nr:glycoside hydrolase family 127 protein [Cytophagales bacterium]